MFNFGHFSDFSLDLTEKHDPHAHDHAHKKVQVS